MIRRTLLCGLVGLLALPVLGQTALGTTFTYQGRLTDAGLPANGIYDLQFALFTAATGGIQVGGAQTRDDVTVTDGLFTVNLDFGASAFAGSARWLEIAVKPGTGGVFTTLSPRQELTATPYSLYSRAAGTATTVSGIVGVATGGTGTNLGATGGPGQYVKQANVGGAFGVSAIAAADLPAHTHGAADLVSGTLPVARGGTGQTVYAVNGIVYATGAGNLASTPAGATGQVLVATGGAPAWSTSTGITAVGTLGSLNVSGTATLGGLSCAGCVTTPALQDASATSAKINPTVLSIDGSVLNYFFDDTPVNNARVCALGPYTASTNQRALLDAGVAWTLLSSVTAAPQVVYSTNGGASWTAAFANAFWATNVTNAWANSSPSGALSLNAGSTYLFAVTGWSMFPFNADMRCFLRVVVVAR